jgi:hypothetical protein
MKLRDGFITYNTDGEQIMVAAGSAAAHFQGMVRSNRTAACIVDCLMTDTTETEVVDKMAARFDAPREVIARDVAHILAQLRRIGALDE